MLSKAQIPLCRLPRDVRDKPVTSHLAHISLRRLPETYPDGFVADVTHGEVGIVEFGHNYGGH